MEELLKQYDFRIDGSHGHWFRFKFTNDISLIFNKPDESCTLVNGQLKKIQSYNASQLDNLKSLLDGLFKSQKECDHHHLKWQKVCQDCKKIITEEE